MTKSMPKMDFTEDPAHRSFIARAEARIAQLTERNDRLTALLAEAKGRQRARSTKIANQAHGIGDASTADLEVEPQINTNSDASRLDLSSDSHESITGTSTLSSQGVTPTSSDTAPPMIGEQSLSWQAFTPTSSHLELDAISQQNFPDRTQPASLSSQHVITAFERELDSKDALIELWRARNLDPHYKCAELVRKCEGLEAKCNTLTKQRLEEKGVHQAMRDRCELCENQCKEVEEKFESLKLAGQKAAEEFATYHEKLSDMGKKYEALRKICETSQREMTGIRKKCATLEDNCAAAQKDMRDLQKKCSGLEDKCGALEAKSEQKESVIAEQKATIDHLLASGYSFRSSHAPDPQVFSGDRGAFEPWLSRLRSKVEIDKMPRDVAVSYAVSRITGPAFEILKRYSPRSSAEPLTFETFVSTLRSVYTYGPETKSKRRWYYHRTLLQDDNERFDHFYTRWLFYVEALDCSELAKVVGLTARLNGRLMKAVQERFPDDCRTL